MPRRESNREKRIRESRERSCRRREKFDEIFNNQEDRNDIEKFYKRQTKGIPQQINVRVIRHPSVPKVGTELIDHNGCWKPDNAWENRNIFIIGGGYSLHDFDFNGLEGQCVIACNDGYKLGAGIAPLCIFGDLMWFVYHWDDGFLSYYKGQIITPHPEVPKYAKEREAELLYLHRVIKNVARAPDCGWYNNTGLSALNLAGSLGAKTAVLLGFDMHLSSYGANLPTANWYGQAKLKDKVTTKNRDRFNSLMRKHKNSWTRMDKEMKKVFPKMEVINAYMDSGLDMFPKMDREEAVERFRDA